MERESKVSFDSPRYHKTQDGIASWMPSDLRIAAGAPPEQAAALLASETVAARPVASAGALARRHGDNLNAPGRNVRRTIPTESPAYS
jgi:hypothetical protein